MKTEARFNNGWSLRRAYGISVALHVVVFAFFIAAPPQFGNGAPASGGASEATTVAYLTIEHRPVVATPLRRVVAKAVAPAPKSVAPAPVPRPEPNGATPRQARSNGPVPSRQAGNGVTALARRDSPGRIQVALATAPPDAREAEPAKAPLAPPVATDGPPAAATDAPAAPKAPAKPVTTDAPAPENVAPGADVPPGGWGQSFEKPLLADDSALAALRARYHGAIQVAVDESGKATHVVLPPGLSDDDRADLEKRLLALRYVPAECNGLRCTGVMALTL